MSDIFDFRSLNNVFPWSITSRTNFSSSRALRHHWSWKCFSVSRTAIFNCNNSLGVSDFVTWFSVAWCISPHFLVLVTHMLFVPIREPTYCILLSSRRCFLPSCSAFSTKFYHRRIWKIYFLSRWARKEFWLIRHPNSHTPLFVLLSGLIYLLAMFSRRFAVPVLRPLILWFSLMTFQSLSIALWRDSLWVDLFVYK